MKPIVDKFLHNDGLLFTFLRSGVSSWISGATDLILSFVFYAWVHLSPWLASTIGAVCGGIVNCMVNYKFTFHAQNCPIKAVIVKFGAVWLGSVALNAWGTEALYHLLQRWDWLETIGFRPDGYFATARFTVSVLVGWLWNFILQRYFVYRPTPVDPYLVRMMSIFEPNKLNNSKNYQD